MHKRPLVGIIGGLGPEAGRLLHGIFIEDMVRRFHVDRDQDHLDIIHLSFPGTIPDRASYIFDPSKPCPNEGIYPLLTHMAAMGRTYQRHVYVMIPCHTYHAPILYDDLVRRLKDGGLCHDLTLIHLVDRAAQALKEQNPTLKRVGLLATTGSWRTGIFDRALKHVGIQLLPLAAPYQELVDDAIYNPRDSLKALSAASSRVKANLDTVVNHMRDQGAEKVLLGCTELPFAYDGREITADSFLSSPLHLAASSLIDQLMAEDTYRAPAVSLHSRLNH